MKLFLQQTLAIFRKDLRCEWREPQHLLSTFLFALLLLLLFSFALSVDPDLMVKMAPGFLWLAILFSSLLFLHHSFQQETTDGQWDGLLLAGCDPKALYLGKWLAQWFFILLLEAFLLPATVVFFDISLSSSLVIVLILGSLGIATLGTFYAGLTASLQEGQLFLSLLLFPMLIPVLLAAVQVTHLILVQDVFDQQIAWLKLLIVFDTVFFLGSLLLAEYSFNKA